MNISVFLTLFYPVFLTSIAVGPVFITIANIGMSYGIKHALFSVLGVALGNILYMIIGVLTAHSVIMVIPPRIMMVISFVATCILIKIAISFWQKDISKVKTSHDFSPSIKTALKMFVITLSSPVVIAGYSITFLTFASSVRKSLLSALCGGFCAAIIAYVLIAIVFGLIGSNIRKLEIQKYFKILKILNKIACVLLCSFASITIFNFFKELYAMF